MSHFDDSPPPLRFPELYIQNNGAAYNLTTAPSEVFGAWLGQILASSNAVAVAIRLARVVDKWSIQEKWQALNELAENGIEMQKYLYESAVAARATLDTQKVEAVHATAK